MKLPNDWSEITIKDFVFINSIIKDQTYVAFDKEIDLLCYFSKLTIEEVESLPIERFKEYVKKIQFLFTFPSEKIQDSFIVNGKIYRYDLKKPIQTAGQYIDLMSFTKKPDEIVDNIHNILAVLCIEEGENYHGEKHKEVAESFYNHLTMDVVYPLCLFFCNVWKNLIPVIGDYLERETKMMNKMMGEIAE